MTAAHDPSRRRWLAYAPLVALAACTQVGRPLDARSVPPSGFGEHPASLPDDAGLLDDLERRTFAFFWETAHPVTGLVPDRWPGNPHMASVAAVGFALTAYVVGAERGLVSRAAARERVLTTVRFLAMAPQGPQPEGMAGHQGFFYHFLDMRTGHRFGPRVELSSIDTSLLLAGVLCARTWFDADHPMEAEIRRLADRLYERVNWPWMHQRGGLICMGWNPERGFADFIDYRGFDEAMLMVLLAMGSPTHPARPDAWEAFCATYARTWGTYRGQTHLGGAPLFWHQYSHVWVDFRGIRDAFMRDKGLDYFENSRRATLAQRAYAIANPGGWNDMDGEIWGLTACDGPGEITGPDHLGRVRRFRDYKARGAGLVDTLDDGTIAPTAALSSLPFAPEVVLPTLRAMRRRLGGVIYQRYGFVDAFNTSFRVADAKLSDGRYLPGFGWVDTDYLGIDQGPIVAMVANHRHELIWRTMRRLPALRKGLRRAGFTGGWLESA